MDQNFVLIRAYPSRTPEETRWAPVLVELYLTYRIVTSLDGLTTPVADA